MASQRRVQEPCTALVNDAAALNAPVYQLNDPWTLGVRDSAEEAPYSVQGNMNKASW